MADFSYEDFIGWGDPNAGDPWNSPMPADTPGWEDFTGWGDPTGIGSSGDSGSGTWLQTILGGLGGLSGVLGPALSAGGALAGGAIGSNAANEAARLQAQALNRGIDLQTAQWLQQQGNLAPYLQAGQGGLAQLQQLAGREQPSMASSYPTQVNRQWYDYGVPSATPGWTPQTYTGPQGPNAGDYRWTPGQGPQAQDYRYTPGQTPDAAAYRYTPGAVPTLSGQELLANDPGVQFRMDEGRKALEASAAARGGLLSGPTLAALQRQGQELGSQEYGQAWNRASQQAQLREGWAQTASQMGYGQAESAARLREQLQQYATQQGWSQAQTEAVFREQMAQQASQQGFNQALGAQGQQFTQGLQSSQYNQQQQQAYDQQRYQQMMQQNQLMYGRDFAENQSNYERELARYNSQQQNQNTQWNRLAGLSGVGQTAVNQLGTGGQNNATQMASILSQLGTAQGAGTLGNALSWQRALGGATNQLPSILAGLNA